MAVRYHGHALIAMSLRGQNPAEASAVLRTTVRLLLAGPARRAVRRGTMLPSRRRR